MYVQSELPLQLKESKDKMVKFPKLLP